MQLLPSQLNELFDLIIGSNYFSPTQFSKSATGDQFHFIGKDYYFKIFENTGYADSLVVNFSPGEVLYKQASPSIGWKEVKDYFVKWLKYLKRESTSLDKWGRIFEEIRYLVGATTHQNQNFSHQEYLIISDQITYVKSAIDQIPLLAEQSAAIKNQLDHLLELTSKLNKFDWQNLFIGTIVGIIIQLGVTKENATLLYELIKRTFQGLFLQ